MARLTNGLETMELGVTSWRIIINDNLKKLYTKDEVDANLKNYQLKIELNKTLKLYVKAQSLKDYALKNGNKENDFYTKNLNVFGELILASTSDLNETTLPQSPSGFIKLKVGDKVVKVPYYKE